MKRNLSNFTRGSQLIGHFGFMFAAGFKGPVLVALATFAGVAWWKVNAALSGHEVYLVWMRVYAALWTFMEFDPAKAIALERSDGSTIEVTVAALGDFTMVAAAWTKFIGALRSATWLSAIVLVPLLAGFTWFAERFGNSSKQRKHERGAMLVSLGELIVEITAHNARARARELRAALGWGWRLVRGAELERAGFYRPMELARVPWPWRLEQSHAMMIGTTGTGKTVALRELLGQARARRQRAVVFDLTGAFIEAFYDPSRDVILNPLDVRCPQWSVFDECRDEAEFSAAAEALVPHDGGGAEQFWVLAARLLFVEMCLRLKRDGKGSNASLASELMTADLASVHRLMRGTIADPLTAPEAARMAESIRAVFNANARALTLLPKSGPSFSVREWISHDDGTGSILFVSARYIDMSVCSQLLTVWLDTAMNALMALDRSPDLRVWFLLDELGALHRLPALEKGLQTARNYGGAIVTGIHSFAKLKQIYGEHEAHNLSSLARTKLILTTADRDTATWCSDFIGHRQVRDMEEGYSYGYNNARDAVSLTPRRLVEPLLLPDELMNLPSLSGYIKFPDGFPAAPVRLVPRNWPRRAPTFLRRTGESNQADVDNRDPGSRAAGGEVDPASAAADTAAANDDGAGRRLDSKQGELALGAAKDVQHDQKEEQPQATRKKRRDLSANHEERRERILKPSTRGIVQVLLPTGRGTDRREKNDGTAPQPDRAKAKPSGSRTASQASSKTHPDRTVSPERDLLEGGVSEERDTPDSDLGMDL